MSERPQQNEIESDMTHSELSTKPENAVSSPRTNQRSRRSVITTDKSEWIMGEDQLDSALSEHLEDHEYGSSNYSDSSNSGSGASDDDDDDDPDKLWCICRKPYGNHFMISCDICQDWFHGHCVGVTEARAKAYSKAGKEWFCEECNNNLASGMPRSAIARKDEPKKEKKKRRVDPTPGKRGRGRPKKSESYNSTRQVKKLGLTVSSSGLSNGKLKRRLSKVENQNHCNSEEDRRIKELIQERKKEFFFKRRLAEQQSLAKRNELGLGKPTLMANLSGGLDVLASSTSSPTIPEIASIETKSNLKVNKQKPIVLQISTKKSASPEEAPNRLITRIFRQPEKAKKRKDSQNDGLDDLFTAEPIQVFKKIKTSKIVKNEITKDHHNASSRKRSNSSSSVGKSGTLSSKKSHKEQSDSVTRETPSLESKHIASKIKESLESRSRSIKDLIVSIEQIEELSNQIEDQLNEHFKEGTQKYKTKFRSLIFNLRDVKNEGLVRKVLNGDIAPSRLVKMSADEMASLELAKWRERENKHSIELIKRDAEMAAQQVIVKKTHKGEEVISGRANLDETSNEQSNSANNDTTLDESYQEQLKNSSKTVSDDSKTELRDNPDQTSIAKSDSVDAINTTNIDIRVTSESESKIVVNVTPKSSTSEQPNNEPKRIRVSIETTLDPSNLSRLRVPLIPQKDEIESQIDDADKLDKSHFDQTDSSNDSFVGDSDEAYDPETTLPSDIIKTEPAKNKTVWTGSITMTEVATFSATAERLSGNLESLKKEVGDILTVCGRIAPDQVHDYIKKLSSGSKNEILLTQIFPATEGDESNFTVFFDYLYTRNRYGVIQVSPQVLKDFYILPVHERSSLPEMLKTVNLKDINRDRPNVLIGLIVRSKKIASKSSLSK